MLSKANRLSLKTDRFRLEKDGRTVHTSLFTYVIAPGRNSTSPIRFALLISKKSVSLSVDRHRLKRLLTELLRIHLAEFSKGQDVILIPRRDIFSTDKAGVLSDLVAHLSERII